MRAAWVVAVAMGVAVVGCANRSGAVKADAPTKPAAVAEAQKGRRYVDSDLGFEIVRPQGGWALDANDELSLEGVSIPVVMRHGPTGAQVVVQVAPSSVTPFQFAERLNEGLKAQPGFTASDPEPLKYSDSAVGFNFGMGQKVAGRVAVMEGKTGRVYMMLATWPKDAPESVAGNIEQIFGSLRVL